jgi:hypothetical protein
MLRSRTMEHAIARDPAQYVKTNETTLLLAGVLQSESRITDFFSSAPFSGRGGLVEEERR